MITDDRAKELHDRATRGMELSDAERAELDAWYTRQDTEESAALAGARPPHAPVPEVIGTARRRLMRLTVEAEQEQDGRWIGEVIELPGVLAYGQTREEAIARVQALALRVLADRLEHGEPVPAMSDVFAVVA